MVALAACGQQQAPTTTAEAPAALKSGIALENMDTNVEETYTVLGPWDLHDADDTIISYQSALANGFLGHGPEETCDIVLPTGATAKYKIKTIARAVLQET